MRFRVSLFLAACLVWPAHHARAESGPVVVELFTSQGCGACPPADRLLGELARRADVVALALHVDYWDYLGWRDRFASPENTRRQRRYVAALGEPSVFTPQMVIDGAASVVGSRREPALEEIAMAAATPDSVSVGLERAGDAVRIALTPLAESRGGARVLYFVYERPRSIAITGGENGARRLTYHNAVREWAEIGAWTGAPAELVAPRPQDARGVAVIVQRSDGVVLGARKLEFEAIPITDASPTATD